MTKYRKNEAFIRNDGVYVISGIFCKANACEKMKARRAEVPSTRSAQSKAAKRLEARGHAQRASAAPEHRAAEGEGGAQPQNTAQALAQSGAKRKNAFPSRSLAVGGPKG